MKATERKNVPLLVMAYLRPNRLKVTLKNLDRIAKRKVTISIDGTSQKVNKETNARVLQIASDWAESSNHDVTVKHFSRNMGLMQHFALALSDFFSEHSFGSVVEDDVDIDPVFFDVIDKKYFQNLSEYWSVCAHNPLTLSLISPEKKIAPSFFETFVHTIWGWASNSNSIENFLGIYYDLNKYEPLIRKSIRTVSHHLSTNPIARNHFCSIWNYKFNRFLNSPKPNWDNLWVLSGWHAQKLSLMTANSMSGTSNPFSEHSTHIALQNSKTKTFFLNDDPEQKLSGVYILKHSKSLDQKLARIWGVSELDFIRNSIKGLVN